MKLRTAAIVLGLAAAASPVFASDTPLTRPKAGKVEIMPESQIKPGMKAVAWTVFQGTEPEPVPIEIVGIYKNQWGPKQDVIVGKMGGKAIRSGVASGMSGSPVYIDGKLVGAVALRMSVFSPDAICGITPIELMLEINDFDKSRPEDAKTPDKVVAQNRPVSAPGGMMQQLVAAGVGQNLLPQRISSMIPIETPLVFAGFHENVLRDFAPLFEQLGITVAQGGSTTGSTLQTTKPVAGWEHSLNPGDTIAGVLVDGDMSVSGAGTVSYNDGKRVLAFGHPFFNLGPMDMPMTKGEVLMTMASNYQPTKMINATDVVGALHQDRHSGIEGVLGAESRMVPVTMKVRSLNDKNAVVREKDFRMSVFVQQKWTPYLMMLSLYNSLSELNDFADEGTYRLSGKVEMNGQQRISLSNMQTSGEMMPAPMALAGWFGDKFNRLYLNNLKAPDVKSVNVTVDLIPERRVATIENAWVADPDVRPGDIVPLKVFLRPYRGEAIERNFTVKIPDGLERGDHRILLSDADTLNRMQNIAGIMNRYMDLPETVSLINQERTNNKLYVSLVEASPTAYVDDKTLPSLPSSMLNVIQSGRAPTRTLLTSPDTATEQTSLPFDYVVSGSYTLRLHVK
jgi:SpoIVB peptidase S55